MADEYVRGFGVPFNDHHRLGLVTVADLALREGVGGGTYRYWVIKGWVPPPDGVVYGTTCWIADGPLGDARRKAKAAGAANLGLLDTRDVLRLIGGRGFAAPYLWKNWWAIHRAYAAGRIPAPDGMVRTSIVWEAEKVRRHLRGQVA